MESISERNIKANHSTKKYKHAEEVRAQHAVICQQYLNGKKIGVLAEEYKVERHLISKLIHSNGIITREPNKDCCLVDDCANKCIAKGLCRKHYSLVWAHENRPIVNESARKRAKRDCARIADYSRRVKYGMAPGEFKSLLAAQEHKCASCGDPINETNAHVDHDHKTNLFRGILCRHCNWGLGHFKDSCERLQKAINYLQCNKEGGKDNSDSPLQ
jgi:recombination endonuclease VII